MTKDGSLHIFYANIRDGHTSVLLFADGSTLLRSLAELHVHSVILSLATNRVL